MLLRKGIGLALVFASISVSCTQEDPGTLVTGAEPISNSVLAQFTLSARILGPVSQDDDADMRVNLTETAGGSAVLNFVRLTCTDGTKREWGAGGFVEEFGSNKIAAFEARIFVRHYLCPTSSRPVELLASLTGPTGEVIRVFATPIHPDWP